MIADNDIINSSNLDTNNENIIVPIIHLEDEKDNQNHLDDELKALHKKGKIGAYILYQSYSVDDAKEALEKARRLSPLPPLIIVDFNLNPKHSASNRNGLLWLLRHIDRFQRQHVEIFVHSAHLDLDVKRILLSETHIPKENLYNKDDLEWENLIKSIPDAMIRIRDLLHKGKVLSPTNFPVSAEEKITNKSICRMRMFLEGFEGGEEPPLVNNDLPYNVVVEVEALQGIEHFQKFGNSKFDLVCICDSGVVNPERESLAIPNRVGEFNTVSFNIIFNTSSDSIALLKMYVFYRNNLLRLLELTLNVRS